MINSSFAFMFMRNILFSLELLAGEWMLMKKSGKHKKFIIIIIFNILLIVAVSVALVFLQQAIIQLETGNYWHRSIMGFITYFVLFVCTLVVTKLSFFCDLYKLLFCGLISYCIRQFVFNFYLFLFTLIDVKLILFKYGQINVLNVFLYLIVVVGLYVAIYFLLVKKVNKRNNDSVNKSVFILFAIVLIINVFIGTISEIFNEQHKVLYLICLVEQMVSVGLIVVLQLFIIDRLNMRNEMQTVHQILKMQATQYKFSKSSINLLNVKIHDLKHQVAILRAGGEPADKLLTELESLTHDYEGIIKTENETVNCLVSEKWMYCQKHNITLTYNIDSHCLDFMEPCDVYSIVGNIIDNAIDAVIKHKEKERRIINLTISDRMGVTVIICNNYFNESLEFVDGMPISSKEDKDYHGFGVKSIKLIADKYNGDLQITGEDNIFTIQVSLPQQ